MTELIQLLLKAIDDIDSRNLRILAFVVVFALLGFIITMCVSHG